MIFSKTATIGFLIGYFIISIGFFPIVREGINQHLIWLDIGLIFAIITGFILGCCMIKFKNLRCVKI